MQEAAETPGRGEGAESGAPRAQAGKFAFFAPGIPKGQPRPRAFSRGGKARVYDPGTAEGWKAQVALAAREAGLDGAMLDGPVSVRVDFFMPRPKRLKEGAPLDHTGKPDLDNLAKAVLDCLTQIGAWGDDAQVTELAMTKRYAAAGARSGAGVVVRLSGAGRLAAAMERPDERGELPR